MIELVEKDYPNIPLGILPAIPVSNVAVYLTSRRVKNYSFLMLQLVKCNI